MASAVIDVTTENKQINTSIITNSIQDYDVQSTNSISLDNSMVQSPSIESFSTFQETENLSELNMDENTDLCVKIDNPQKQLDTLETFITFRIITKVARIEFTEHEYVVRRRYNDFIWLRQKLVECYPAHIVPPLPGKHSLIGQLDRYSKDFIFARMKLLNIFMSRLVNHPILSCNEYFKIFLTAKLTEFNACRKQKSVVPKISTSLTNIAGVYGVKNKIPEFEKSKEYLNSLSEKLIMIEKISNRISKERLDYITELNNFYPILSCWAMTEPELSPILHSLSLAIEKSCAANTELVQSQPNIINTPIREFLTYVECVKEVLNKRDNYQIVYENSVDELAKKRSEKENLMTSAHNPQQNTNSFSLWRHQSSDQKLEKLGVQIPQIVKQTEHNQDKLECANEALRSDLERWNIEKRSCLKNILLEFVNKQIEYYEKSVEAWETVVNDCTTQNIIVPTN